LIFNAVDAPAHDPKQPVRGRWPESDAEEDSAEAAIRNAMAIQPNGIAFGCSRCCHLETERT
jgi:hypothetical protein